MSSPSTSNPQEVSQTLGQNPTPLALPPPPDSPTSSSSNHKLDVSGTGEPIKFDELGPLVVNSDGTLSRIANWQSMTEPERERTMRVLVARNKIRLANQEATTKQDASEAS
ncbi:hypothetical protein BC629DRAFT_1593259 [Irpex lacteus]|nr:hypothetical protein BC629DRAFT_1593259 [Irpex lacteus]